MESLHYNYNEILRSCKIKRRNQNKEFSFPFFVFGAERSEAARRAESPRNPSVRRSFKPPRAPRVRRSIASRLFREESSSKGYDFITDKKPHTILYAVF